MINQHIDLYRFDAYLGAKVGSVNLGNSWTPELRSGVTEYLLHEIPDDQYAVLLHELPASMERGGPRIEQVKALIDSNEPLDIGIAAHYAAVKTAPSLGVLIDSIVAVSDDSRRDYTDVGEWMDFNATAEQRLAFVSEIDPDLSRTFSESDGVPVYITDWIEWLRDEGALPPLYLILQAWKTATAAGVS